MRRPLLVTDCDEVLLHMVVPFAEWLDEVHDVHFNIDILFDEITGGYLNAMRHKASGEQVESHKIWPFLKGFFETEMDRQKPITGAVAAVNALAKHADVVVLTNLTDDVRDARAVQLSKVGINFPVFTNQGGKGAKISEIIADHNPSMTIFVDDLGHQHDSVAELAPDVIRLHMVGEPRVAHQMKTSDAAHVRIDDWPTAERWIMNRFEGQNL